MSVISGDSGGKDYLIERELPPEVAWFQERACKIPYQSSLRVRSVMPKDYFILHVSIDHWQSQHDSLVMLCKYDRVYRP